MVRCTVGRSHPPQWQNHTVSLGDGFSDAQHFMREKIKDWIRKDIGGKRQRIKSSNTHFSEQTFKHILLPVWITHYSLEKKRYRMSVNGKTGKVYGQRPFSTLKLLAASVTVTSTTGVVGFLISLASGT